MNGVETPAHLGHAVIDSKHIELIAAPANHHGGRVAPQLETGNLLHALANLHRALVDALGVLQVALLAHGNHGSPRGGHESAWTAALKRGAGVNSARPVDRAKPSKLANLRRTKQQNRAALLRIAVLVRVSRNARHARHAHIKRRDRVAQTLQPRQQISTETSIHMQTNVVLQGELANGWNVINDAVRKLRRRAGQHDCVGVDQTGHYVHVHSLVLLDGGPVHLKRK